MFELILSLKLDKRFPVERFEATASVFVILLIVIIMIMLILTLTLIIMIIVITLKLIIPKGFCGPLLGTREMEWIAAGQ